MMDKLDFSAFDRILKIAVKEDLKDGDITTDAIFPETGHSEAVIVSKEQGVFCGGEVLVRCYKFIDPEVKIKLLVDDGEKVDTGKETAKLSGPTKSILSGERIALNFIQRMSGISTKTADFVSLIKNSGIEILDTRKTLPGYRLLDKYSVKTGGGTNHRIGLYDMVMIKDNHIKAAGSISGAVKKIRDAYGRRFIIEVEASVPEEALEAADSGADIIMLDNMNRENIEESVKLINSRSKIEISGNISRERILDLVDLDIDYISIGSLTHSVKAFDLSMKFL